MPFTYEQLRRCHGISETTRQADADFASHGKLDLDTYVAFSRYCVKHHIACIECGRLPDAEHITFPKHILSHAYGGTDEPSNLIPLCWRCHDKARGQELWNRALQKHEGDSLIRPNPHVEGALSKWTDRGHHVLMMLAEQEASRDVR